MEQEELSPLSSRHMAALEQADAVLEIVGGNSRLDGFNLLGVVANPRAGGLGSSTTVYSASSAPSSTHGRYNPIDSTGNSSQSQTTSYNILSPLGYFQSFEQTITQVSESIGVFNNALEDWSRSILEDHPTVLSGGSTGIGSTAGVMSPLYAIMGGSAQEDIDAIPESQLKELPEVLENPTVSAIQAYIQQSGPEADSFQKIVAEENSKPRTSAPRQRLTSTDSLPAPSVTQNSTIDLSDIPEIFFDDGFDLTDPTTFCELLLLDKGIGIPNSLKNSSNTEDDKRAVTEIIRVPHPDSYNGFFDKVELALLEQVRANSNQFFVESQRFAGIHKDIHQLLDTVQEQKSIVSTLKRDVVQTAEVIPACDDQRGQLRQLWEVIDALDNLFICKEGLAGIISAKDDLLSIEQIQHGRKLLYPIEQETQATFTEDISTIPSSKQQILLGRIRALKSISEQFNRYEELVVSNLLDELVEIFLTWNDHSISSQTSSSGSTYVSSSINFAASSFVVTNLKDNVRKRVKEVIIALQSCHAIMKAEESYQIRLQDMIRMIVRTTVSEFASDGGTSISSTISSAAAAMSFQRFLDCLDMLFDQLVSLLTSTVRVDAFLIAEGLSFIDTTKVTISSENADPSHFNTASNTTDNGTRVEFDASPKTKTPLSSVLIAAVELSSKSISELLRIRKEAHSLVSLEEMKALWDKCTDFIRQLENLCVKGEAASQSSNGTDDAGNSNTVHVSALRSTLLSQAKAFVERKHESHMSSLVAALDSERWVQSDVSAERQYSLDRLCSGRTILIQSSTSSKFMLSADKDAGSVSQEKLPEIEAEGVRYKVVWSCLLLLEMILTNIAISAQFSSISTSSISKVAELLRLFNSRTTHLVLGAGAIHSNARLKSINAKHLSLVTQCLGLVMAILPHVRAALATQMPKKQHTLLTVLDQIKKEYADHNEKILNKFVSIIGGIVEHGLMKQIYGTDFDKRAKAAQTTAETPSTTILACCSFLDGVSTNTRKMHQVLSSLLPPDHLKDVFSRIFAYIDGKVPSLFITAAETSENQKSTKLVKNDGKTSQQNQPPQSTFTFPKTIEGKRQLLLEVESTTTNLNNLEGIHPWDFTARNVLERRLEYSLTPNSAVTTDDQTSVEKSVEHSNGAETNTQPDDVTATESNDHCDDGDHSTISRSISQINSQDEDNEATLDLTPSAPESGKGRVSELAPENGIALRSNDAKEGLQEIPSNGAPLGGSTSSDSSQSEPNKGVAESSAESQEHVVVPAIVNAPEALSGPNAVVSDVK